MFTTKSSEPLFVSLSLPTLLCLHFFFVLSWILCSGFVPATELDYLSANSFNLNWIQVGSSLMTHVLLNQRWQVSIDRSTVSSWSSPIMRDVNFDQLPFTTYEDFSTDVIYFFFLVNTLNRLDPKTFSSLSVGTCIGISKILHSDLT